MIILGMNYFRREAKLNGCANSTFFPRCQAHRSEPHKNKWKPVDHLLLLCRVSEEVVCRCTVQLHLSCQNALSCLDNDIGPTFHSHPLFFLTALYRFRYILASRSKMQWKEYVRR